MLTGAGSSHRLLRRSSRRCVRPADLSVASVATVDAPSWSPIFGFHPWGCFEAVKDSESSFKSAGEDASVELVLGVGYNASASRRYLRKVFKEQRSYKAEVLEYEYKWLQAVSRLGWAPMPLGYDLSTRSLVMEYADAYELWVVAEKLSSRFYPGAAWTISCSLCAALVALENYGLAHRDLHWRNVLVAKEEWKVLLIDPSEKACEKKDLVHLREFLVYVFDVGVCYCLVPVLWIY